MPRRVLTILAITMVAITAATIVAYASGNVPYALVSKNHETSSWVKKHCSGAALGRPAKCPNPGTTEVPPLPAGDQGVMVSVGDSFSAGEGAPSSNQYRVVKRVSVQSVWDKITDICHTTDIGSCLTRHSTLQEEVWGGASGFYPGTDVPSGNTCHRSPEAYAPRMARDLNLTLDFRACSGAVTKDYYQPQNAHIPAQAVLAFTSNTKLVTVGFGGNNVNFADIVFACIGTQRSARTVLDELGQGPILKAAIDGLELKLHQTWKSNGSCAPFTQAMTAQADDLLGAKDAQKDDPTSVRGVLHQVRLRAPKIARVIATSYPHMFPDDNHKACGMGTGEASLGPSEQKAINQLVDKLNSVIRAAAALEGVDFVDMTYAFVPKGAKAGSLEDHGMCQNQGPDANPNNGERWINRFRLANDFTDTADKSGSVHPNAMGQSVYAEHMLACYRERTSCDGFLDSMNWKAETFAALKCPSPDGDPEFRRDAWDPAIVKPRLVDVTGDGKSEVVVEAQCPTTTSSNPTEYAVFDVSSSSPQLLGVLGREHYYRVSTLTVTGRKVMVAGTSVGENDGFCCADHTARDAYSWNGTKFVNTSSTETSPKEAPEQATPGPTVDALITSADASRRVLTYDVVQWFEGAAALKACKEDGVTPDAEWCNDYYWRNANKLLRIADVPSSANLKLFDQQTNKWKKVSLTTLASYARGTAIVFTIKLHGTTKITSVKEHFMP